MNTTIQSGAFHPNMNIYDSTASSCSYGGNQAWFESNTRAYAGCGSVAAANMLYCLMQHEDSSLLNSSSDLLFPNSRTDFIKLMNDLYSEIGTCEVPLIHTLYDQCKRQNKFFHFFPPSFGRSICGFIKGVLRYADSHCIYLHAHTLPTAFCPYDTGIHFIEKGLRAGYVVILLTSFNRHPFFDPTKPSRSNLDSDSDSDTTICNHFSTITAILYPNDPEYKNYADYYTSQAGHPLLLLSTWGKAVVVDYNMLASSWNSRKAFDSALFYFSFAESKEIVRTDIKNARRMLFQALRQTFFKHFYD